MKHTKTTLPNGMRIITVPMKDTKSLTLLALFGTGSRYENKQTNGVSHFLEHLFFKGTKRRPRAGAVSQALDDIGAEHNAFTAKEYTGYWVKSAAPTFSLVLDIVADILLEPLFKAEEIEKERGVIFQELSMYVDDPRRHVHSLFESFLYGDHPMGWEIIGTPESLRGIKREDILSYRKSHYVGSNAVLAVAGAFEENTAFSRIESAFMRLAVGVPMAHMAFSKKEKNRSRAEVEYKKTDQTHIVMGCHGYHMFDDKRFAVTLLATILGGKTSSRLFQEIREKRGLAYTVSAGAEQFKDTGYFSVYAGVPHGKAKEVVKRIRAELYKITKRGVPESELKRAKDFWRGQFAIGLESSDEVASFYGGRELFYGTIITPEEVMARISQVSREDIAEAAKELFKPESLYLTLIGPHKRPLEFESLLSV